ncbi:Protein of unknown function [Pyronema omphalodes CBS 100304]|uniref:Uncharacterized protein n=1 Tax=Pyronema omphalodes (strain CBS 100304) TaxID=1076935 RepID=U4LE00_PYROM|nr:Protein of unknown function [Pyronema omphalodes CBS 100304]
MHKTSLVVSLVRTKLHLGKTSEILASSLWISLGLLVDGTASCVTVH